MNLHQRDLTNQKIGKRVVLGFANTDSHKRRHWKFNANVDESESAVLHTFIFPVLVVRVRGK